MLVAVMDRAIFWSFLVMDRVLLDWDLGTEEPRLGLAGRRAFGSGLLLGAVLLLLFLLLLLLLTVLAGFPMTMTMTM